MSRYILIIVALTVLAIGWYFLGSRPSQPNPAPTPTQSTEVWEILVAITNKGFNPKEITIKSGEVVTWVNEDNINHTVNSSGHPTHLAYPPLNTVDLLKPGEKKSLIFPDPGTYDYHDHLNPTMFGSITVL